MKLRYLLLLAVLMVIVAAGRHGQPAFAQSSNETVGFKNVVVLVNPEYDDPRLLVMMQGNIAATPPVRVSFLVPAAAEMNSAGSKDAQDNYAKYPGTLDRNPSEISGWDEISYQLVTDTFRVEYYDPSISGQPDKSISYDFRTISPIGNLRMVVQQPKKATNFAVTPRGNAGIDGEGFTVFSSYFNNVSAGAPVHFDIAYTRSDPNPSISPSSGISGGTVAAPGGGNNTGLIAGVVVGVILIGVLGVWILKSGQPKRVPVRGGNNQPRRGARSLQKRSSNQGGAGNKFCTRCGHPVDASDKFCPSCGTKVD